MSTVPHYTKILSNREQELCRLFGFGWSHEKVAAHAGIAVATSRTHMQNILHKLDLHSGRELVRWAIQNGLTNFNDEPQAV